MNCGLCLRYDCYNTLKTFPMCYWMVFKCYKISMMNSKRRVHVFVVRTFTVQFGCFSLTKKNRALTGFGTKVCMVFWVSWTCSTLLVCASNSFVLFVNLTRNKFLYSILIFFCNLLYCTQIARLSCIMNFKCQASII